MKLLTKIYRYFMYGPIYMIPAPMPGMFLYVDGEGKPLGAWNDTEKEWEQDMPITDPNFFVWSVKQ